MGFIPATGTEIAMGKVYRAFGLTASYPPANNTDIGLNSTLGANRQPPYVTGTAAQQTAIPAGAETSLSEDFGGLTSISDYPYNVIVNSAHHSLWTAGSGTTADPFIFTFIPGDWNNEPSDGGFNINNGGPSRTGCHTLNGRWYVYYKQWLSLFTVQTAGAYNVEFNVLSANVSNTVPNTFPAGVLFDWQARASLTMQNCGTAVENVLPDAINESTKTYTYSNLNVGNTLSGPLIYIEQYNSPFTVSELKISVGFDLV